MLIILVSIILVRICDILKLGRITLFLHRILIAIKVLLIPLCTVLQILAITKFKEFKRLSILLPNVLNSRETIEIVHKV